MGNDDADAMAALISSKTGINAKANAAAVDLKPSATATGKGIELQIGANEGQTMNFTLDDMSADALGVAGNSVNLIHRNLHRRLQQLLMQLSRRFLLQEAKWVPFRTDLRHNQQP